MIQLPDDDYQVEIADQQDLAVDTERLVDAVVMILQDYQFSSAEISIALVDDPTIRELNRQYLEHDYETDVLSFLLVSRDDFIGGQLIVSTGTADRIARELNINMEDELLLYVVHGMLHLVGLDDLQPDLAVEMRDAEREYLARFGVVHHWLESEK